MKTGRNQGWSKTVSFAFSSIALLAFLMGLSVFAEAYNLPDDRVIEWKGNVGVEGGIPNRTTICSTLNPGATNSEINSALSSCPSGQVVYLNAGTYNLTGSITLKSNKTLRGSGMNKTILNFTSSLANDIVIGGSTSYTNYNDGQAINITSNVLKGANQLPLQSSGNLTVGSFVYISQLPDTSIPVSNSSKGDGSGQTACNYCGIFGAGGDRIQQQTAKVTAINGTTITINPPLYFNLYSNLTPTVHKTVNMTQYAGVEDLTVKNDGTSTSNSRKNILFMGAANSWIKNLRIENCGKRCVDMWLDIFRNEMRECYVTKCLNREDADSCYTQLGVGSANLIEDNIFTGISTAVNMFLSSSGNVVAYNYGYDNYRTADMTSWFWYYLWDHGTHNQFNLMEGNDYSGVSHDIIHGSNSHNTLFRNRLHAKDTAITYGSSVQNVSAINTSVNNNYMNHVGNVLGTAGWNNTYEIRNSGIWSKRPIFATDSFDSTVTKGWTTQLRHMNYDYFTNSVKYCDSEGEPGCQGGPSDTALPPSLYLDSIPPFWGNQPWPPIGPDVPGYASNIPAKDRFEGMPEPVSYIVTPSAGANGSISPNTPRTVNMGTTETFTVTPNYGYTASVGGTCGGTLTGSTYITNSITADCTVMATFTPVDGGSVPRPSPPPAVSVQ